ncbi:MAG: hypothetical protein VW274_07535 [Thalassolituus sp.]
MTAPERGTMSPVTGENDDPDMNNAIDVQFNPVSLKVNLANTLKANERDGSSGAAQYVDKSSSTLTLDLMFDTTRSDEDAGDDFAEGSDVRDLTRRIAETFIKPEETSDNKMKAPKRCLFQWGSFEFIGMVESYDETLEYFSPQGRPLRAKLALKLKEDRFQFRQRSSGVSDANPAMPTLSPTGQSEDAQPKPGQEDSPVPGPSEGDNNWRDTSDYNGIENPRMPGVSTLATPTKGCKPSGGLSAGVSAGFGASAAMKASASVSASASLNANLNTGLSAGLTAGINAGLSAGLTVSAGFGVSASSKASAKTTAGTGIKSNIKTDTGVGFE